MNLVRAILLSIEELPAGASPTELRIEGVDTPTLREHLILLEEEDFIEAILRKSVNVAMPVLPQRLTWKGHEFLEAIRSDTVWEKTKEAAREKGVGWTVSALSEIAKMITLQMIQGPGG